VVLYASHANTPDGTVLNPYNTRAGIEAVLRALGPR